MPNNNNPDNFVELEWLRSGKDSAPIYINPRHVQAITAADHLGPDASLLWLSDAETTAVVRGNPRTVAARLAGKVKSLASKPQAIADLALQMNRLGIPVNYGNDKVRRILMENGLGRGNMLVAAAIRYRKQEAAASASAAS